MAGPASPGSEGPTFEPPSLPPGWIAQWDGNSKKYYYVQLSTGVSQWEVPTEAAPVGGTPAAGSDHPYGLPGQTDQLITHADGSQTVKRADGTMEPIMPQGSRGVGNGQTGDRGLGKLFVNALSGGHGSSGGSHDSHGNNGLGGVAGQLIGQFTHGNKPNSSSGSHGSSGGAGKLVGALASNLFSKPSNNHGPQNYHSSHSVHASNTGGIAGSMMGGVAGFFGGGKHASNQNYGYSNAGHNTGYSGSAPPASYQPGPIPSDSYPAPPSGHYQGAHTQTSAAAGYGHQGAYGQTQGNQGYGAAMPQTPHYGAGHPPQYVQPSYAAQASYSPQHGNSPYLQQPHASPYLQSQPMYAAQQPQSNGQHHY